ncbi:MAG: ABC transporter permease, partial [Ktedonobacteraceae bacterium]|nr:ABC transporter permease [Ktedonobacteraceae bacterium]
ACSLLLLRLFPLLLRLGTILATRNRNVAPMLALAQMARAPQQSVRVALLLLFTTAFVVFVSIFTSSQNAHLADVANYWTGADFSGPMPASATTDQQAAYQRLRGVTTATTGYVSSMVNSQQDVELKLIAADPAAFMRVVIWPEMGTAEQKSALNQVLSSKRAQLQATMPHADTAPGATGPDDAVPAIVDETTWDTLQLTPGKRFILRGPVGGITFLAMGKVAHIPTINDRSQTFGNGGAVTSGLLVDYQSYAAVYNYHLARQERNPGGFAGRGQQPTPIRANYVWMSTQSDAQTLAGVRKALSSGPLQLAALYDRRATMQTLRTDPLSLNLVGMLILGAAVPLLLTWVGCLIASWATTRQRQTLFGVLRALGCPPRQLTRVLVWEQAIVYGSAVVLGVLFGLLTALMALPSLVLTSAVPGIYVPSSGGDFMPTFDLNNTLDLFSLQNTPPAHTVISPSLGVVIGLLVLLGVLAVALMSRGIARMTLSQVLRVNRD